MAIGEVQLAPISAHTLRLSVLPGSRDGSMPVPPSSSELAIRAAPPPLARIRSLSEPQVVAWSGGKVELSTDPLVVAVTAGDGRSCQRLRIENGEIRFALGDGRLFGLGQGGQQFDRRGGVFPLVNGQGEGEISVDMNQPGARAPHYDFDLAHEGARVTKGAVIARLNDEDPRTQLRQAEIESNRSAI